MPQVLSLFVPDDPGLAPIPEPTGRPDPARTVRNWRPRVDQLVEKYLRHCRAENKHGPTRRAHVERTLRLWCEKYAQVHADEFVAGDLEEWVESHPEWKKPGTRRNNAAPVKALFRFGWKRGYVPNDPFAGVEYKNSDPAPEMTDDVFERICRRATKPLESALRFLRLTGCRTHEAREAKWRDFDLSAGVWTIPKHKRFRTTGKPRKAALSVGAVAFLRALLADRPRAKPDDLVFQSTRGNQWYRSSINSEVTKIKRKLGLDTRATAHGVRHRFARAALKNGASEKQVADQLGHRDTAMVSAVYGDLSDDTDFMRVAAEAAAPRRG